MTVEHHIGSPAIKRCVCSSFDFETNKKHSSAKKLQKAKRPLKQQAHNRCDSVRVTYFWLSNTSCSSVFIVMMSAKTRSYVRTQPSRVFHSNQPYLNLASSTTTLQDFSWFIKCPLFCQDTCSFLVVET